MSYIEEAIVNPTVIRAVNTSVHPQGFPDSKKFKTKTASPSTNTKKQDLDLLKVKKAWEMAFDPAKSIPMNLFMSYMTGNSLQIIPIMMTAMLFLNPLKSIFSVNNKFSGLVTKKNSSEIQTCKIVFVLCEILGMGIGVWKLNNMGLIPNSRSDWLAWESPLHVEDIAVLF